MNTSASVLTATASKDARLNAARYLYLGTSSVLALLIFLAFTATYFSPMAEGTLKLPAAFHIHGPVLFVWTLLCVAQTATVAYRNLAVHRVLGMAGISVATLVIFTSMLVSALSLHADLGGPREERARMIAAHGQSQILLFAAFFICAIAYIKRGEWHKRLMVLSMFSILQPAVARLINVIPIASEIPRPWRLSLAGLTVDLLLLTVIVLDARLRGTVHRVYVAGLAFLISVQCLRVLVLRTDLWRDYTSWLASLAS